MPQEIRVESRSDAGTWWRELMGGSGEAVDAQGDSPPNCGCTYSTLKYVGGKLRKVEEQPAMFIGAGSSRLTAASVRVLQCESGSIGRCRTAKRVLVGC